MSAPSPKPYAWVLKPAAVILALVAVVLALTSLQLEMTGKRADALEARLTTVAEALTVEQAKLTTDFSTAADMRKTLKASRAEIESVRAEAVALGTTPHLPAANVEPLTRALISQADALAAYCDALLASAEFVIKRAETFTKVAAALDQLSGLSKDGVTVAEGEKIVRAARKDFDTALAQMRDAAPPSSVLYSNFYVLPRLDELSVALSDIEEAIVARDVRQIASALESYMKVVGEDWAACMTRHDPKGRLALNAAARTAGDLAPVPAQRAKVLRSSGQSLLMLTLVAAVAAVLSVLGALRWRDTGH
jgi:uncharacterized membrane-anchored protein YhcB (DUF1043 family)